MFYITENEFIHPFNGRSAHRHKARAMREYHKCGMNKTQTQTDFCTRKFNY